MTTESEKQQSDISFKFENTNELLTSSFKQSHQPSPFDRGRRSSRISSSSNCSQENEEKLLLFHKIQHINILRPSLLARSLDEPLLARKLDTNSIKYLDEYLRAQFFNEQIPYIRVLEILRSMSSACLYLMSKGVYVINGELNPLNILVDTTGASPIFLLQNPIFPAYNDTRFNPEQSIATKFVFFSPFPELEPVKRLSGCVYSLCLLGLYILGLHFCGLSGIMRYVALVSKREKLLWLSKVENEIRREDDDCNTLLSLIKFCLTRDHENEILSLDKFSQILDHLDKKGTNDVPKRVDRGLNEIPQNSKPVATQHVPVVAPSQSEHQKKVVVKPLIDKKKRPDRRKSLSISVVGGQLANFIACYKRETSPPPKPSTSRKSNSLDYRNPRVTDVVIEDTSVTGKEDKACSPIRLSSYDYESESPRKTSAIDANDNGCPSPSKETLKMKNALENFITNSFVNQLMRSIKEDKDHNRGSERVDLQLSGGIGHRHQFHTFLSSGRTHDAYSSTQSWGVQNDSSFSMLSESLQKADFSPISSAVSQRFVTKDKCIEQSSPRRIQHKKVKSLFSHRQVPMPLVSPREPSSDMSTRRTEGKEEIGKSGSRRVQIKQEFLFPVEEETSKSRNSFVPTQIEPKSPVKEPNDNGKVHSTSSLTLKLSKVVETDPRSSMNEAELIKAPTSSRTKAQKEIAEEKVSQEWQEDFTLLPTSLINQLRGFRITFKEGLMPHNNQMMTPNLVNAFMQYLSSRINERTNAKRLLLLRSDFITKFTDGQNTWEEESKLDYQSARRVINEGKESICDSYDRIICPVYFQNKHWLLGEIDFREDQVIKVKVYDPAPRSEQVPTSSSLVVCHLLQKFLQMDIELRGQKETSPYLERLEQSAFVLENVPKYTKANDSGVFILKFAEALLCEEDIHFNPPTQIPLFRKRLTDFYLAISSELANL